MLAKGPQIVNRTSPPPNYPAPAPAAGPRSASPSLRMGWSVVLPATPGALVSLREDMDQASTGSWAR